MSSTLDRIPPGKIRLTYEDYCELPDDGKRYEIIDGELEVSPAPSTSHQIVSINLSTALHAFVREHRLGRVLAAPVDVILEDTSVIQPDVVYVRAGREGIITRRAIEGPPDLMVEILSTWSTRRDRSTKAALYARFGIPHYWIVDPEEKTLERYELDGDAYRLVAREQGAVAVATPLLPGLSIPLAGLWD